MNGTTMVKPQMNADKRRCSGASAKRRSVLRWVTAPQSSLRGAPAVQGVALAPGDAVQWLWMHTPNGSYVSGYNITLETVILSKAKNLSCTGRLKKRQRPFAALRVTNKASGG
jgi:hypothetical protein